jgi:hypothetical protein
MGRIKKGILGGFSGKVGTVVGANWKTISYIRSLPQNVKNPRTVGQVRQRTKLALVVALLKPLITVLRIGWKLYAKRQSAFNACTAYTLANAITGTFPNFQIDYRKVMISRGNLPRIHTPLIAGASGMIRLTWQDNSQMGNAQRTDKLLFAVINPTKNETITKYGEAQRSTREFQCPVPDWVGDQVHVYAGFVSEDGKEISDSHCISPTVS